MAHSKFDPRLVRRAQDGDGLAREVLLGRLAQVFKNYFRAKVGNQAIVDDLMQCALIRVHSGLSALKHPDRFKAFAMKAALFELHDYYRGRHSPKEQTYDTQILSEKAEAASDRFASTLDIERVLSVLTPHARRILELREYGYKYKEIANILGTTETAVKMQVKRAFEKMRNVFADE